MAVALGVPVDAIRVGVGVRVGVCVGVCVGVFVGTGVSVGAALGEGVAHAVIVVVHFWPEPGQQYCCPLHVPILPVTLQIC